MIKNQNDASTLQKRPVIHIKDSLLGDALERNKIIKPAPYLPKPSKEIATSQVPEQGGIRAA
jgi:hypothetical protein